MSNNIEKCLSILGIRGIPANHGGFETFAEKLALYLVDCGWEVTVYCQKTGTGPSYEDVWCGVRRVWIPVSRDGPLGTVIFDWKSTIHAARRRRGRLILTLGYNTAIFCLVYRLVGLVNAINMDGLEWKREKWSVYHKTWLWLNERAGCLLGNRLIADHPSIADHLATRVRRSKIEMIPYGADEVASADDFRVRKFGLVPGKYATVIARPEPENSLLEIVSAFSRKKRGLKLVLLGKYDTSIPYHRAVIAAAGDDVILLGAIYDKDTVQALRFYSRFYIHGHRVGGTNPSLVEALGAGSAVLAHDNLFNRWVAEDAAHYFSDEDSCANEIDWLCSDDSEIETLKGRAKHRFNLEFRWETILTRYRDFLQAI